jgi:ribosomal protein S18 acetylase RimI-like enzyme
MTPPTSTPRRARRDDLPTLVALYADDPLGATRERSVSPLPEEYLDAFAEIDRDPNQFLAVFEEGDEIVGTLQLTLLPSLTRLGAKRAQIESVRVARSARGRGLGRRMVEWAIREARRQGATLLQLTTDKTRTEAQRFYEGLGFVASHEGMKLALRGRRDAV